MASSGTNLRIVPLSYELVHIFLFWIIIDQNKYNAEKRKNLLKKVSEYDQEKHNHILQTKPWHREEEPKDKHTTPTNNGKYIKQ